MAAVNQRAEEEAKLAAEKRWSNVLTTEEGGWPTHLIRRRGPPREDERPSGPSVEHFMLESEDCDVPASGAQIADQVAMLGGHNGTSKEQPGVEQAEMYD